MPSSTHASATERRAAARVAAESPFSFRQQLCELWRHVLGRTALCILAVAIVAALGAQWLAPHNPNIIDYDAILTPPSATYILGTDELGRDIFSRVLRGAQVSLQVVAVALSVALVAGCIIGMVAGYYRGWVDDILMRLMDGLMAFPGLILALAIVAILGPDLINAMIAISIVNIPGFARLVRGQVLSVREQDFVQAAETLGASDARIMLKHIWPAVSGNVLVYASLKGSTSLITESALSFLGLGVQPPTPSWGQMLATGMKYTDAWWMSIFPGLAIFVVVIAFNFLGDAARDVLDPKLTRR